MVFHRAQSGPRPRGARKWALPCYLVTLACGGEVEEADGVIVTMRLRAHSPAEAEELIGGTYQRPRVRDSGEPFFLDQHTRGDERATITRFRNSSATEIAGYLDGIVGIGRLNSGRFTGESRGAAQDVSRTFVVRPGESACWSEQMDLTMVNLDLAGLADYADAHDTLLRQPVRFDALAASAPEAERAWSRALAHTTDVFRDEDLLRNDIIRMSAVGLLYAAALIAFADGNDTREAFSAQPASVRRALRYIDEHAAEPIGVADIAHVAGLSPRGLESAFQRTLGTTPTARLREVRLAHAHDDLLAATPGSDNVADIARRWGFAHLGRFATHYRATYHRLPRESLGQ